MGATLSYSYDGGKTWETRAQKDPWPLDGQWKATTAFTLAQHVQPITVNGFRYECTVAGTSAGSEPTWPTTIGNTVADGTVTWTCRAAGVKIVRYRLPATPPAQRRIMVKIAQTDSAKYGIRQIRIKSVPNGQDNPR